MSDPQAWSGTQRKTVFTVLAVAVALGLAAGGQAFFTSLGFGRPLPVERAVAMGLRDWLIWAAFLPLIWTAARRYPLEAPHWTRDILMHVVIGSGFAVAYEFVVMQTSDLFPEALAFPRRGDFNPEIWERLWWMLSRRFIFDFSIYGALALTGRLRTMTLRIRERERTELELRSNLAEARMQSLKMQLQPHFLFNTLNAIATLIHKNPRAADEMLGELSELLRTALEAPDWHSLEREMNFLNQFLRIQQMRFGDRLRVTTRVEPEALGAEVPAMILQPIVENALRHGIEAQVGPGQLEVVARRIDDSLELVVSDNGRSLNGEWREGIGLKNTRARLQQHFGSRHQFEIQRGERGTTVRFLLPFGLRQKIT